jgi:dihydroneopterin aldolase
VDLADGLLAHFPRVKSVTLDIRKFILPETESVAVRIRRSR